jgi:hypothetical protein
MEKKKQHKHIKPPSHRILSNRCALIAFIATRPHLRGFAMVEWNFVWATLAIVSLANFVIVID